MCTDHRGPSLYRDALTQLLLATLGAGVEILVASSAEDGLKLARGRIDLCIVLADLGLPGLSGTQAIAALREVVGDRPIIAVSASEERRQASAILHEGACARTAASTTCRSLKFVPRSFRLA